MSGRLALPPTAARVSLSTIIASYGCLLDLTLPDLSLMSSPPPPGIYSPPPQLRDYQRYSDEVPSSGNRPSSREDQHNYFDHVPPAPYRLSGSYISPGHSPRSSVDNIHHPRSVSGSGGPTYLSPLAAASATDSQGVGLRHSNYSEMSMIGLNQTPGLQRKSTWLQREQGHRKKNHRMVSKVPICLISYHFIYSLLVYHWLLNPHSSHYIKHYPRRRPRHTGQQWG